MKKKLFKSKTQMVVYIFLYLICICLFIYIGNIKIQKDSETESKKFSNIYKNVAEDNLYVFASSSDVLNILKGRSGVILFGFPKNKWTEYYANILDTVAKEVGVDTLYYYDFLTDRDESNGVYETIVNLLKVYVPVSDIGVFNIMAPTVVVVKDGEILGYFDDTSLMKGSINPNDYYNENRIALTKEGFKMALEEYLK